MILFFAGLIFLIARKVRRDFKLFFFISIAIVYTFFTLVETKMPGFTVPVIGFVLLIIAFGITEASVLIPNQWIRRIVLSLLVVISVNWMLKPNPTLSEYGFGNNRFANEGQKIMLKNLELIKSKGKDSRNRIVFGVDFFPSANISWMFYNNEIAYSFIPSEKEIEELESKGFEVVILSK